jgi:hypothetical protein
MGENERGEILPRLTNLVDTWGTMPHSFSYFFLSHGVLRFPLMLRGLSGRTDDVS